MRELALHVLDVVENAIEAGAQHIDLWIVEDLIADRLTITIRDDGRGMDAETLARVHDPFYTTRTTRHVGLGLPLFIAAAERCAGGVEIESAPGKGTTVTARFQHSHIDRAPLGDLHSALMCILMRESSFDLDYVHQVGGQRFEFDTQEFRRELGDVPLTHPEVRNWLSEFVALGEQQFKEN